MTQQEQLHRGRKAIRPVDLVAVVKRIKSGKMPRVDTALGQLCRDAEAGLLADLGDGITMAQTIKVGLVLQLIVLVAGLPLFGSDKRNVHPAYRWAVDQLLTLLDQLGRPGPAKTKDARQGLGNLAELLNGEDETN